MAPSAENPKPIILLMPWQVRPVGIVQPGYNQRRGSRDLARRHDDVIGDMRGG